MEKAAPPGGNAMTTGTPTPRRTCAARGCLSTATPSKQCPRCKEQGLVDGSYFCDTNCFQAAWPEHKRRHKTEKTAHKSSDDWLGRACGKILKDSGEGEKAQAEAMVPGEGPQLKTADNGGILAQAPEAAVMAFAAIKVRLAEWGLVLEGDGLEWRRRDIYDKGRRLVAAKAFRPGDIIFRDDSCLRMPSRRGRFTREDFFHHFMIDIFYGVDNLPFLELASNLCCLWPAVAFPWTTEQDEAELDGALAAATAAAGFSPMSPEPLDDAYFLRQGQILNQTLKKRKPDSSEKEEVESMSSLKQRVDDRLLLLRCLWDISPTSDDVDGKAVIVLARLCQILHYNRMQVFHASSEDSIQNVVSFDLGVGLNHSCWPNSAVRVDCDAGEGLGFGLRYGGLILYATADIQVGEEVTVEYVDSCYPLPILHNQLRALHGFQCRDCPRCRNGGAQSPTLLDHERRKAPSEVERTFLRELKVCHDAMQAEIGRILKGQSAAGEHRSMSECFAETVPALHDWISRGELVFRSLDRALCRARGLLAYCLETRQDYAQAIPLLETMQKTEREVFPRFSRHRIFTLKRLVKALALHGQGGTARFDELVEEVSFLMRVNYGDDTKDVDDESRDLDSYITKMQAALALRQQQEEEEEEEQEEGGRTGGEKKP